MSLVYYASILTRDYAFLQSSVCQKVKNMGDGSTVDDELVQMTDGRLGRKRNGSGNKQVYY